MAVEAKRLSGWRRIGDLTLVGVPLSDGCERFPLPLHQCPLCGHGVKFTRGFSWVAPGLLFANAKPCNPAVLPDHAHNECRVCKPGLLKLGEPPGKVGLVWAGRSFYTVSSWLHEASTLGVCRKVPAIPKGLVVGKTRIFVAHVDGYVAQQKMFGETDKQKGDDAIPAAISCFVPERIEVIVTAEMEGEAWVQDLVDKHGVTPVVVPADDADHAPVKGKRSPRKRAAEKYARYAPEERETAGGGSTGLR